MKRFVAFSLGLGLIRVETALIDYCTLSYSDLA